VRSRRQQEGGGAPAADSYEVLRPVLIICGDCSGDGLIARKTVLGANGRCEACGGNNYVLASAFGVRFYTPAAPEIQPDLRQQLVYADFRYDRQVKRAARLSESNLAA
jgi:hypothetical protein